MGLHIITQMAAAFCGSRFGNKKAAGQMNCFAAFQD